MKMIVLKLVIFMLCIASHHCRLPDKVYCVNPECNAPISKAKTILGYNSGDKDLISFRGNAEALIYMKSAGSNPDLWYAKIDEKSGFVNSRFLRENKIYEKNPQHILPVEVRRKQNEVVPDRVQQAHEIFEGTTIYSTEPAVVAEETTTLQPNTATEPESTPMFVNEEPNSAQTLNSVPSEEIINPDTKNQTPESVNESPLPDSSTSEAIEFTQPTSIESPVPSNNNIPQDNVQNLVSVENPTSSPVMNNIPDLYTPPNEIGTNSNENQNIAPPEVPIHIKPSLQEVPTKQIPTENFNPEIVSPVAPVDIVTSSQEVPTQQIPPKNVDHILSPAESIPSSQIFSSNSEEILSSSSIEVPDKVDYLQNTLTNSQEVVDNLESNASFYSLSNKDTQLPHVSSESNVPDKNIPSQPNNIPQVPQSHDNSMFGNVYDQDGYSVNNGEQEPLPESSEITTESTTLPSTESSQGIMTEQPHETTNIDIQTITEETIVPKFSYLTTETTLPPKENLETNIDIHNIPKTDSETLMTQSHEPSDMFTTTSESAPIEDTYTTPSPHIEEYDTTLNEMPSSTLNENLNQEENNGGFLSTIFSSISSMWSSSSGNPPEENIFNTESVHEPETADFDTDGGFSFINYFISTYNSVMGTKDETNALFQSAGETCFTDEYCDGSTTDKNNRLLTFLLTTASSVLLFILGYYYIDIKRQDSKLIGKINSLQRDLLFSNKECEILKEELSTTKSKLAGIEDNSFGMDDMVQSLKEEINEMKAQNARLRNSLDDNEKLLRVSENTAGELQNTLSEVENTLSELLGERANAEEQIAELNGKIQAFEEELISVTRDRDNFQLKYVSAETALDEAKKQLKQLDELNEKLKEAQNTIELQKHELIALKDAMKEIKSGSGNIDIGSLIDHTEIKAKLSKALEEKKYYESKYEIEHKERSRLAEELQTTRESMSTTSQQAAEALTRLEVLGKYFQERESELMKELSAKESLWLSKQGESASTVEKMELLQQEIQRYKEKCDALTLELAEQESTRRTALSEVEARAHAAWLEARAARRDADAARDDAAALRRKLASLTAADGAVSPHRQVSSPLEAAEVVGAPPPLPPMPFLPPLLPPLPRPPPLGRLPSPHPPRYNDRRYSPDSRYSPESRYSPGSRYSPETVRYSPRDRRSAYSPRSRRRSRERYESGRGSRSRAPLDTETEYNSDSPSREPRRRPRYSRHSGPSSGSGCSSESDK